MGLVKHLKLTLVAFEGLDLGIQAGRTCFLCQTFLSKEINLELIVVFDCFEIQN